MNRSATAAHHRINKPHWSHAVILVVIPLKKERMRFRISHLLLFTAVVAFGLAMRSVSVASFNDTLISVSALCTAILISVCMVLLGEKIRYAIIFATIAASIILILHHGECWMKTASTEYVWKGQSYRYYHDIYDATGFAVAFGCALVSCATALLTQFIAHTMAKNAG